MVMNFAQLGSKIYKESQYAVRPLLVKTSPFNPELWCIQSMTRTSDSAKIHRELVRRNTNSGSWMHFFRKRTQSKIRNPFWGASRPMRANELPRSSGCWAVGHYLARCPWSFGWAGQISMYLWDAPKTEVSTKIHDSQGGKAIAHLGLTLRKTPRIQATCVK